MAQPPTIPGMPTHVALLRGVNLGPSKRVPMPALRKLVESLGHEEVATYIASGNVVFTPGKKRETGKLAKELEKAIADEIGVDCRVLVLTRAELAKVVKDNPYEDEPNPKAVHANFLLEAPTPAMRKRIAAAEERAHEKGSRDEAKIVGRTLFIHTPDGYGRSELNAQLAKGGSKDDPRALGTARNWATVLKLLELCDA
jgi:uncharacterized protein (DUF1697 family)